jgi:hypothetical protein
MPIVRYMPKAVKSDDDLKIIAAPEGTKASLFACTAYGDGMPDWAYELGAESWTKDTTTRVGWKTIDRYMRELGIAGDVIAYLSAVAALESGSTADYGNCDAVNPEIKHQHNAAAGLFGIRARQIAGDAGALFDPREAVKRAIGFLSRLRNHTKGPLTPAAARRGWALPGLTDDYNWDVPRSRDVRTRIERVMESRMTSRYPSIADWKWWEQAVLHPPGSLDASAPFPKGVSMPKTDTVDSTDTLPMYGFFGNNRKVSR